MSRGKRNAPKLPDGDDGRTIVPMDVDGMPWHLQYARDPFRRKDTDPDRPPMAKDDRRAYVLAAVGAGLLIAAVFAVGYGLFLLFCRFVWLR